MKSNLIILFAIMFIFSSCLITKKSEPLYYKYIKSPNIELYWFYYSYLTSDSPDFIIIKKNKIIDTICISNNIIDLNVTINDTIKIDFYGYPMHYNNKIIIPEKIQGCNIKYDTTKIIVRTYKETFKMK